MKKQILLTGDRPTGQLHLGHYVGTLKKRVELQTDPKYKQYVFISDQQALTDNARNPELIRTNLIEVALDYLAVGISPEKSVLFVQSQIPELAELTMYYMNLVTIARLQRNPTVKEEIKQKNFGASIPAGFLLYPVSQAADITAFDTDFVPAGEDQEPVIEQTREIVRTFNSIYGEVLVEPQVMLPDRTACNRLPGVDGQSKMGKSLDNAIYLADEPGEIKQKIMRIFTDPNHLKVSDPGTVEGNTMFTYLDAFCTDIHFAEYLPEYSCLDELKDHYRHGGLGDVKVKEFLNSILQAELAPIRQKRQQLEKHKREVYQILLDGSLVAREVAAKTLERVRNAIGLNYFDILKS